MCDGQNVRSAATTVSEPEAAAPVPPAEPDDLDCVPEEPRLRRLPCCQIDAVVTGLLVFYILRLLAILYTDGSAPSGPLAREAEEEEIVENGT